MAGLGFELRKIYEKKSMIYKIQAYQVAGIVCSGPLLFSAFILAVVFLLTQVATTTYQEQSMLICMLIYTMIASLIIAAPFTMVINRYVADLIYEKRFENVMSSFFGYVGIMLLVGGVLYGIYLSFSGLENLWKIICLTLFMVLTTTWAEMNYLSAIKDYKGILAGFVVSLAVSVLLGFALINLALPLVSALLISTSIGCGIMMVWYLILLLKSFPRAGGFPFAFLKYFSFYPSLSLIGIFQVVGLLGHQVLMWTSPAAVEVMPLFSWAPSYDLPAFFAFLTTLVTTISFTMTVEVRFYPKYRAYFAKLNGKSTKQAIETAEQDMFTTLSRNLYHTMIKQCVVTIVCIVLSDIVFIGFNLGFTNDTIALFSVLCVGYAFFAIGNMLMLVQLYFSSLRGAMLNVGLFAVCTLVGTVVTVVAGPFWYGYGFLFGAFVYCAFAWVLLRRYVRNPRYYILSSQPIFDTQTFSGVFYKLQKYLERLYTKGKHQRETLLHKDE